MRLDRLVLLDRLDRLAPPRLSPVLPVSPELLVQLGRVLLVPLVLRVPSDLVVARRVQRVQPAPRVPSAPVLLAPATPAPPAPKVRPVHWALARLAQVQPLPAPRVRVVGRQVLLVQPVLVVEQRVPRGRPAWA